MVIERGPPILGAWSANGGRDSEGRPISATSTLKHCPSIITRGWDPACACPPADPVPGLVLDPFNGAGTSGAVAIAHNRRYWGIELLPAYLALTRQRLLTIEPEETHDSDPGAAHDTG